MKDTDSLFKDSLWYCEVELVRRPEPVLILKMPFCDGKPLFGCRAVVPGLKLQLGLKDKGIKIVVLGSNNFQLILYRFSSQKSAEHGFIRHHLPQVESLRIIC